MPLEQGTAEQRREPRQQRRNARLGSGLRLPPLLVVPLLAAYAPAAQAVQYLSVAQFEKLAFAEANQFEPLQLSLSDQQLSAVKELGACSFEPGPYQIWRAEKSGVLQGYVVVDQVLGKHDYITFGLSLTPHGEIGRLEILEYREARGSEVVRDDWRKQFAGKTLSDGVHLDLQIKNISGATLSCKHITDRVRGWLAFQRLVLR